MSLRLPKKGLRMADAAGRTYDAATGTMTIASLPLDANGRGTLELNATGIDLAANGTDIDHESHSLTARLSLHHRPGVARPHPGGRNHACGHATERDGRCQLRTRHVQRHGNLQAIEYDLEGEGNRYGPDRTERPPGVPRPGQDKPHTPQPADIPQRQQSAGRRPPRQPDGDEAHRTPRQPAARGIHPRPVHNRTLPR